MRHLCVAATLLSALITLSTANAAADTADPPDVASYTMDVRLDATHRVITGHSRVRWTNTSALAARELWWHLYMNAFANPRTLFMRTGGAAGHRGNEPGAAGRIDVLSMRLAGVDLLAGSTNDPAVVDDATQLRTPLATPVEPGATVEIDVEFRTQLPGAFARTGYWQDFAFAGQWFPKLARLESDGHWAHFAFHANAEFYADFGRYEVALSVPHGDVLGATGDEVARVEIVGAFDRHRFVATRVHDFAWTAWRAFEATRVDIDGIEVLALSPPGMSSVTQRALSTLQWAIRSLRREYGRYPYRGLTVVVAPRQARGVGGMEYPTLITLEGEWFEPSVERNIEWVTAHEYAHQYFYGLLASNESAWPFLDEGLADFATGVLMTDRYGIDHELLDVLGFQFGYWALEGGFAAYGQPGLAIARSADAFPDYFTYGNHVYRRTGALMRTASESFGRAALRDALRTYAHAQSFRHPAPPDLLGAVRTSDAPAATFVRDALFGDAAIDFAVTSVRAEPRRDGAHRATAHITREGTLVVPVEIEFEADDGSRQRTGWDGATASYDAHYVGNSPLRAVRVDPDERVPLDRNRLNNALNAHAAGGFNLGLLARIAFWFEALVRAVGP